jgi:lipoyl(octanoyl) transferase
MKRVLQVLDLGRRSFAPVFALQEQLVERRKRDEIPDTLILVEHDPVYTLGRNATEANILASGADIERMGIAVVRTTRGGQVTYHGPGQIVAYPILDLAVRKKGVQWYVDSLEEVVIRLLASFGVRGARDARNRGVWVGPDKIAAIGVRVTRHVTMHGLAVNITTDLTHYRGIIPCGIRDAGVTSLARLAPTATVDAVKPRLVESFREVLGYDGTGRPGGPPEPAKEDSAC